MNKIHIKRQHNLGRDQVRDRVDEIAKTLKNELNAECTWENDSLCFNSPGASGTIDVSDDDVELHIELGMILVFMKDPIEKAILKRVDEVLG